jgi:hypothetical protein
LDEKKNMAFKKKVVKSGKMSVYGRDWFNGLPVIYNKTSNMTVNIDAVIIPFLVGM